MPHLLTALLGRASGRYASESERRHDAMHRALAVAAGCLAWHAAPDRTLLPPHGGWGAFTGQAEALDGIWLEAVHPDDRPALTDAWDQAARFRTPFTVEHRLRRHDGAWCWMQLRAVPVPGPDGQVAEWAGVHRDITPHRDAAAQLAALAAEREHREAQLAQDRRMEAIGRLLGGVAHDLNNALTAVMGGLELLDHRTAEMPRLRRLIGGSQQAAARGAALVAGLLAFSRAQAIRTETTDLGALLSGFVPLLRHAAGPEVTVELSVGGDVPPVRADAGQVETAVLNLVLNARDAMGPAGGTVSIRVSRDEAGRVNAGSDGAPPPLVSLTVSDTGPGLPPTALARCFEPFFTTKDDGPERCSGLGLFQVAMLARNAGGRVDAANRAEGGASFTLLLPSASLSPAPMPAVPNAAIPARPAADGGAGAGATRDGADTLRGGPAATTVLLVEDDADIRGLAAAVLDESGYRVIAAADAAAAWTVLDRVEEQVDLLFTDLRLPDGEDGTALARRAQRRRPALPVLLTSGHASGDPTGDPLPAEFDLLPKPYRPRDLLARLERLLPGRTA